MPLQASGQIKASEVNTELGRTSTLEHKFSLAQTGSYSAINTNNAATDRPDQATPHSISEWYNYNHNAASANVPNSKYWSWGGSTTMTWLSSYTGQPNSGNTNFPTGYTDAFTIAFWVSVQNSSTGNLTLIDIRNSSSTANRILVQYNYNQNKLVFLRRASSGNSRQEWNLHDHNSVCGLGTSSSNKWTSSNRGNVNTHNFTQLIFTYDGSGTGNTSTGMDCYWNGSELTTHLLTANFNTNSLPNMGSIGINGNFHNTGGLKDCDWDMIQIYNKKLSTTEISNLYNSGSPTAAANVNLNSDLVFEDRAEESTQVINGVTHNIDDTTDQFRYGGSHGETLVDY